VTVQQGEAMGRPSKITVTFRGDQCWLSAMSNCWKDKSNEPPLVF
jgi:predicted PhzF superfamily epimerase YddE/YHI9